MYIKYKILCKMWYYECIICFLQIQRTGRESYQIYRTKETVNVLIPSTLIERHLTQRSNLQITIGAVPDPSLLPSSWPVSRSKPDSRPGSSWPTIEDVQSSLPSYQDVLAGRFGAIPVDSPVEEEVDDPDPTYEHPEPIFALESRTEPRGNTNIFTDSVDSNVSPSGRGRGEQHVALFSRGRGLSRRPFLGRGRNADF